MKIVVLVVLAAFVGFGYVKFRDDLKLQSLAKKETQLRSYQNANPTLVYGGAFLFYVAVTGLSLPGAAALSLTYAWFFGFWRSLVLISFASTAGATVAFLLSRFLLRDWVQQRFGERLTGFNESLEKEGPFYLFTLRLIPAVPFFVINAVMGLTPIKTLTFWWVSQIGMLAGTIVYTFAGSRVPNLQRLADEKLGAVFSPTQLIQITGAFVLLGTFPLVVRFAMSRLRKTPAVRED